MSPERKGTVTPCRWTENRNGAGTNSEESDAINHIILEVERRVREGVKSWCSNPTVSWRTSPKTFSTSVTYVIKLSKAYKASSNVLKEIVKLSKEKYK